MISAPMKILHVSQMRIPVPRQMMRLAIRIVLHLVLAWLFLALLWAFLPSPNSERADGNGVDYPTRTLLAGKILTRVYRTEKFRVPNNHRSGFALDYQFDPNNLAIRIGQDHILPLFQEQETNATEEPLEIRLSAAAEHNQAIIEKKVLSLRHEIQKGIMSPGQKAEIRDVERTSELLEKLESYSYLEPSVVKRTKIDKVLKVISKLPDLISLDDLYIKERATALLDEWNVRLALPQHGGIISRLGDEDGANLPWFRFADAVLLYWWIQKDVATIPITARVLKWVEGENDFRKISLYIVASPGIERGPILTLELRNKDASTVEVAVPQQPLSSSPSWTYPIRVTIIRIIAPTAVLVNSIFNNVLGVTTQIISTAFIFVFCIFLYGFLALGLIFSFWRCFGGPSFEDTTQRLQEHLATLDQNKRLKFLKLGWLHDCLDSLYQNKHFKNTLDICRYGWHPELHENRAAEDEEAAIMDKAVRTW